MRNVELFNVYAGKAFALLYEAFPLPKAISVEDLVNSVSLDDVAENTARQVAGHTMLWLADTGYVNRLGEIAPFRYVLSSKGFEVLNTTPFDTEKKPEPPLGDQLLAQTKNIVSSAAIDVVKDTVKKALGVGILAGFKYLSGP